MVEKKAPNKFSFLSNKKERINVEFLQNEEIELNVEVNDDEITLLRFSTIKDFRFFCNSITDIIEYKDNEVQ